MPVVLSETDIQTQILSYLKLVGIFAWRNNTRVVRISGRLVRFGAPGSPDIIGALPSGRFLAIEVKAPGGKPSPEQREFLSRLERAGALVIIADSLEVVVEALAHTKGGTREGGSDRATPPHHISP